MIIEQSKKTSYFFVCFDAISKETVALHSQVIGIINALSTQGISLNLITFAGIREFITSHRAGSLSSDIIKGKWMRIWLPKPRSRIGISFSKLILGLILLIPILRGKKILLHCRGTHAAVISKPLVKFYSKISVLLDMRDDLASEYIYMEGSAGDSKSEAVIQKNYKFLQELERIAAESSGHILCVSESLKKSILKKYSLEKNKVTVIPCTVDSSLFCFDSQTRLESRRLLKLENKFVLVYSGSLIKWQLPESILNLYKAIKKIKAELHLLIITPHVEIAENIFLKDLGNDEVTITTAEHEKLSQYLMTADMSLLIRDNHPLNAIASPIKVGEYLMCGLPVIITPNIGDVSDFIVANELGILMPGHEKPEEVIKPFVENYSLPLSTKERSRIYKIGTNKFGREIHLTTLVNIYNNLTNGSS